MTEARVIGHNTNVTRLLPLVVLVLALGPACTGRTSPAGIGSANVVPSVVDAGAVDTGVVADAGTTSADYPPCAELSECPSTAVRCTIERSGICNPTCDAQGQCPVIDGKSGLCVGDGNLEWCILTCGEDPDCPSGYVCTQGGTCVNQ